MANGRIRVLLDTLLCYKAEIGSSVRTMWRLLVINLHSLHKSVDYEMANQARSKSSKSRQEDQLRNCKNDLRRSSSPNFSYAYWCSSKNWRDLQYILSHIQLKDFFKELSFTSGQKRTEGLDIPCRRATAIWKTYFLYFWFAGRTKTSSLNFRCKAAAIAEWFVSWFDQRKKNYLVENHTSSKDTLYFENENTTLTFAGCNIYCCYCCCCFYFSRSSWH